MVQNPINIYAVLLAGGSGTRLWPVSRELYPKQLACFFGDCSLIANTVTRLFPVFSPDNIRVVCGKAHENEIGRELARTNISPENKILAEPCGRNTAPAVLLSLLDILEKETDAIVFIFPADHVIRDIPNFHRKVEQACRLCEQGYIVTFGIKPEYAETGYGYIEASEKTQNGARKLKRFVEKPDKKTAQSYLAKGNFFWNSGMFAFRASVMLDEFRRFKPEMVQELQKMGRSGYHQIGIDEYEMLENTSIDYAIMEQTEKGVVLPSDFGWNDIGSWKSLYDYLPKDQNGNVVPFGDSVLHNTKNSFVMGQDRLIAVNGLENIVIVETPDSIFVSDLETSREVKQIVGELKKEGRKECRLHSTVCESWGAIRLLEETEDSIIKKFELNEHAHAAEWMTGDEETVLVIVSGRAKLEVNDSGFGLDTGQSQNLPPNTRVRVKSLQETPLVFLTIQKPL